MSFYNMLFGKNPQASLLLAVIGLREHDVERFRDVHVEDGKIVVYTRTGGGNRPDYPNKALRSAPGWQRTWDDDFDSTYAYDEFEPPAEFAEDLLKLSDILAHGMRPEFAQHLAKTLRREPTDDDKAQAAYNHERAALARTRHFMANGHTFVPKDDGAMKVALERAEANGGNLRSAWGILPLQINITTNAERYGFARYRADYEWKIDREYWARCKEQFAEKFPVTMAAIEEAVNTYLAREDRPKR